MSEESPTTEQRLKTVETTVATWGRELHAIYEQAERAATAIVSIKSAKEKGTDWIARGLALAALAVALFAALTLHFKVMEISQTANPEIHVDNTGADPEVLRSGRIERLNQQRMENEDATARLPGHAGGTESTESTAGGPAISDR